MNLLEVNNLVKRFGGLSAVDGVTFQVRKGEVFGLIGPNGSGKTTLFNLVSGFHQPTSGSAFFQGRRIDGLKPHKINRLGLARTFQVVKPLKRMTVFDNVLAAAFSTTPSRVKARETAQATLLFCGLEHRQDALAGSLTIGDRKRLEITRALATKPQLLLLDETFAGLNPTELDQALLLIEKIRQSGVTIMIVEHIMKVIMSISDRVLAINFGRAITQGPPRTVAAHAEVIEAYLGKPLEHEKKGLDHEEAGHHA